MPHSTTVVEYLATLNREWNNAVRSQEPKLQGELRVAMLQGQVNHLQSLPPSTPGRVAAIAGVKAQIAAVESVITTNAKDLVNAAEANARIENALKTSWEAQSPTPEAQALMKDVHHAPAVFQEVAKVDAGVTETVQSATAGIEQKVISEQSAASSGVKIKNAVANFIGTDGEPTVVGKLAGGLSKGVENLIRGPKLTETPGWGTRAWNAPVNWMTLGTAKPLTRWVRQGRNAAANWWAESDLTAQARDFVADSIRPDTLAELSIASAPEQPAAGSAATKNPDTKASTSATENSAEVTSSPAATKNLGNPSSDPIAAAKPITPNPVVETGAITAPEGVNGGAPSTPKAPAPELELPKPIQPRTSVPTGRLGKFASAAPAAISAAGVGMGTYGVVKTYFSQEYEKDIRAGGARAVDAHMALGLRGTGVAFGATDMLTRGTGRVAIAGATTLEETAAVSMAGKAADGLAKVAEASSFLGKAASGAGKILGPAGTVIQAGAGYFEYQTAKEAGDAYRATNARGSTIGGIVLGLGTGFAVGWETGPGAIITMIGGGIVGSIAGGKIDEKAFGEGLQKEFDAKTQAKIDEINKTAGTLVDASMLKSFSESTAISDKYAQALKGYYTAEQTALTTPVDPQGKSLDAIVNAANQLEDVSKSIEKLPKLNADQFIGMQKLRDDVGAMYAKESMRTVPSADKEAEERRQENVKQLAESYNKIQVVLGIDSANTKLSLNKDLHNQHAREFGQGLSLFTMSLSNPAQSAELLEVWKGSEKKLAKIDQKLAENSGYKPPAQNQPELFSLPIAASNRYQVADVFNPNSIFNPQPSVLTTTHIQSPVIVPNPPVKPFTSIASSAPEGMKMAVSAVSHAVASVDPSVHPNVIAALNSAKKVEAIAPASAPTSPGIEPNAEKVAFVASSTPNPATEVSREGGTATAANTPPLQTVANRRTNNDAAKTESDKGTLWDQFLTWISNILETFGITFLKKTPDASLPAHQPHRHHNHSQQANVDAQQQRARDQSTQVTTPQNLQVGQTLTSGTLVAPGSSTNLVASSGLSVQQ